MIGVLADRIHHAQQMGSLQTALSVLVSRERRRCQQRQSMLDSTRRPMSCTVSPSDVFQLSITAQAVDGNDICCAVVSDRLSLMQTNPPTTLATETRILV